MSRFRVDIVTTPVIDFKLSCYQHYHCKLVDYIHIPIIVFVKCVDSIRVIFYLIHRESHTHAHTETNTCIHTHTHTHTCINTHTHKHTLKRIDTHTRINTHTHT